MTNDSRIYRFYGALDFWVAVSTKMSLLTELGDTPHPVQLACTGNPTDPSLYLMLEVMGKEKVMGRIERALGKF